MYESRQIMRLNCNLRGRKFPTHLHASGVLSGYNLLDKLSLLHSPPVEIIPDMRPMVVVRFLCMGAVVAMVKDWFSQSTPVKIQATLSTVPQFGTVEQ